MVLLGTGGSPIAIVGTSTRIDLTSVVDGGSGPGPSVTTSVALDIHGLTPWSVDDTLEVDSRASGFVWYDPVPRGPPGDLRDGDLARVHAVRR